MIAAINYYKNKNIFEKMSEYDCRILTPPTYFLHTLAGWLAMVTDQSVYVGSMWVG